MKIHAGKFLCKCLAPREEKFYAEDAEKVQEMMKKPKK